RRRSYPSPGLPPRLRKGTGFGEAAAGPVPHPSNPLAPEQELRMSLFKSSRIAWSVACASLALWAFSAPAGWSQVSSGAAHLFQSDDTDTDTSSVINIT